MIWLSFILIYFILRLVIQGKIIPSIEMWYLHKIFDFLPPPYSTFMADSFKWVLLTPSHLLQCIWIYLLCQFNFKLQIIKCILLQSFHVGWMKGHFPHVTKGHLINNTNNKQNKSWSWSAAWRPWPREIYFVDE